MSAIANEEFPSFSWDPCERDPQSIVVSCETSHDMRKLYGDVIAPKLYDSCRFEKIDGRSLHDSTKIRISVRDGQTQDLTAFFNSLI
jgi:hypothetical protein